MKRILFLIAFIAFLAAGCSPAFIFGTDEAEPRLSPSFEEYVVPPNFVPRTIIMTALGDSLTQGVGDEEQLGGYVGRLAADMEEWDGVEDVVIENTAKRGRRSDQLLKLFEEGEVDAPVAEADILVMTMGGNDLMKIVKRDLFSLDEQAFYDELKLYEERLQEVFDSIRALNPTAPFIVIGIYNPFSLLTDEVNEFDEILTAYNDSVEELATNDPQACFVPVADLFVGNESLVYHTDFFHPNSNGYDTMTERVIERMEECGFRQSE